MMVCGHLRSKGVHFDKRLAGLGNGGWRVVAEEEVYDTHPFMAENDIN